jgi:hypothetical protein
MTWAQHHTDSEHLAAEAELAARAGQVEGAKALYRTAAVAEAAALEEVDPSKNRTLAITAVSAVALWYKAEEYAAAEQLAHLVLGRGTFPQFAVTQLQALLQAIWSAQIRQRAGVRFVGGEVLVAVRGGRVVTGGAPLDLVLSKVETVKSLFHRTTEFVQNLPYRSRGPAAPSIQQACRPWLFHAAPSSYQFAVAIEDAAQGELFGPAMPSTEAITRTFLAILRAAALDPGVALPQLVPNPQYRSTFMKLTRNLAPTGNTFSELQLKSPGDADWLTLDRDARESITRSIRKQFPRETNTEEVEEVLRGVLRGVHLDQDWLEISLEGQHVRVYEIGDAVDDVVGPYVNKPVVVEVVRQPNGKHRFRDIWGQE